jgi:hypothetical protein
MLNYSSGTSEYGSNTTREASGLYKAKYDPLLLAEREGLLIFP